MQQERKEISGKANTIAGFSIPLYLGILALVVVCMYMDCLPAGLVGGMIALMVLGEGLNFLGNHTPVVKTYLGGSVICILGAAVIQALGLIPEQTHEILDNFVNKEGFLVFYISALITGSLFNIDRGLLIRATVKLLPTAVISLAVGVILSGLLGMVMGDSFLEGILYIGIPMTSGGMTAGAVPLSAMYSSVLGTDAGRCAACFRSQCLPAAWCFSAITRKCARWRVCWYPSSRMVCGALRTGKRRSRWNSSAVV